MSSTVSTPSPALSHNDMSVPLCTFVSGPRDAGKTTYILERLRTISSNSSSTGEDGAVAVLLAEEGRLRAESLSAGFRGLILRRLFLPCQCCPELARLPAAVRSVKEANPKLDHIFIEVPDVTALRFLEEFDATIGWPRTLVTCMSTAWQKARRLQMLLPYQLALIDKADVVIEREQSTTAQTAAERTAHSHSPTTAPFDLSL